MRLLLVGLLSFAFLGCFGSEGPVGPRGLQGDVGPRGLKGDTGDDGDTGDTGVEGLHCWDLDGDAACDLEDPGIEDLDGDGSCTVADCRPAPQGAAAVTAAEVQVFDGTSPTTWTALDLSGVVGLSHAWVMLRLSSDPASPSLDVVAFRAQGDPANYPVDRSPAGSNQVDVTPGGSGMVVVTTDGQGVIEWTASQAVDDITIDVISWIGVAG